MNADGIRIKIPWLSLCLRASLENRGEVVDSMCKKLCAIFMLGCDPRGIMCNSVVGVFDGCFFD